MTRSERLYRRLRGFENLEAKTSPTSLSGISVAVEPIETVAIVAPASVEVEVHRSPSVFLQFVSSLDNVSLEHSMRSQAEADIADQFVFDHAPPN